MTVTADRRSRLRCEALYPSQQARWPGRWIDEHGTTVHGLIDPATREVEIVDPSQDQDLPGLARWLHHGVLVGYRPGRRAVVRLAGPPRYVKIVRPRRLAELVARLRVFDAARIGVSCSRSFPISPAVLDHDASGGWVVLGELPGSPMTSWEPDATYGIDGAVARALVALQTADPAVGVLPEHIDRSPWQWAELLAPVVPSIAEMAWRVAMHLPSAPQHGEIVVLHGDLHDGNVFLDHGQGVGVIDLDSLAVGHPAVDPANLAAHLVLRALLQGKPAGDGDRRATTFLAAYRSAGGRAEPAELACSVAHCLHRLACVYAVRTRWAHLAPTLLRQAQRWSLETADTGPASVE